MAQTKHQIEALLAQAGSNGPRHRFGQNFMIDQNLVRLVAEAGRVERGDVVVEVGPGTGTLTEELLERADEVAGKHELNADLLALLASARAAGRRTKLVANLPYNIASPLVIGLLIED